MLNQLQSKLREQDLKHKFELDKYKSAMDTKFKTLVSTREQEWEKAWEKREEVITSKDRKVKDSEVERAALKETLARKEYELEAISMQVSQMMKDHQKATEEYKQRIMNSDRKYEELL